MSEAARPACTALPARSPFVLEQAFDDPDAIRRLIHAGAPYRSMAAVHREPPTGPVAPWFRNFWALGGKLLFEGAGAAFRNPRFIDAARRLYGARVVRPLAMMTNLNPPAPAAPPHQDLPFFRGAHRREVPAWMLAPMGYSGLFERWAIPVASAITWLYDGPGGEFEYWPDGLEAASRIEANLAGNRAVIADNETMYHRVRRIGEATEFLPGNVMPYESVLEHGGDGWTLAADGEPLGRFAEGGVRVSILWKAFCFADETDAQRYLDGTDDLTPRQVVSILQDDLRGRGIVLDDPASLDGTDAWADAVRSTYLPAAPATSGKAAR
ncbi:MAG: hypothetical protein R3E48_18425 [Burkholderiaceae bacterium]